MEQGSISTPQQETPTLTSSNPGFVENHPKVKLKNTARVRVINPILGPTIIVDEFSSQTGGQGAPPERDKTSSPTAPTPDTVL